MTADTTSTPAPAATPQSSRTRVLTILSIVVLVGLAAGAYEWGSGGSGATGTAIVSGTVTGIYADDTDFVKAGQPLVQLDPADAKVALQQAQANLAQTVRQVRSLYANNHSLDAQIAVHETDVARAQTELARAKDDLQRRQAVAANGAVSQEELGHAQSQVTAAQDALTTAQAKVQAARDQLTSNQALTDGTSLENHPNVLAAAAKVREAYLALHRAALPAPVDGYVAKRTVRVDNAVATTPEQAASIQASLTRRYGPGLEINYGINPALIGGLRIQVGSDLYDGSVKARLEKLQQSF